MCPVFEWGAVGLVFFCQVKPLEVTLAPDAYPIEADHAAGVTAPEAKVIFFHESPSIGGVEVDLFLYVWITSTPEAVL
jgi:hypothetical protein